MVAGSSPQGWARNVSSISAALADAVEFGGELAMTGPVAASAGTVTSWAASALVTARVTLAAIRSERVFSARSIRWVFRQPALDVGLVRPVTGDALEGRGDAGQCAAEPAGEPGLVSGQVDAGAVEDPAPGQELIEGRVQPADLPPPGPGRVCDYAGAALAGLGLAGIQVRGVAHHQPQGAMSHASTAGLS
jgi:hypothetical protein